MTTYDDSGAVAAERSAGWWERRRDAVLYPLAGAVIAAVGLVWPPMLSMILTPAWIVLLVWYVPSRIERSLRGRR